MKKKNASGPPGDENVQNSLYLYCGVVFQQRVFIMAHTVLTTDVLGQYFNPSNFLAIVDPSSTTVALLITHLGFLRCRGLFLFQRKC